MKMTPLCSCKQLGDKRECTKILPTPQNKLKTLFRPNFLINHFKTNVTVGKKIPTAMNSEVTLQSKEHLRVEKWISVDWGMEKGVKICPEACTKPLLLNLQLC